MLTVFYSVLLFALLINELFLGRVDWPVSTPPSGLLFAGKCRVCCGVSKGDFVDTVKFQE